MRDKILDWLFPLTARVERLERIAIHVSTIIVGMDSFLKTKHPDYPSPALKFLDELRKKQHTPRH